MAIRSDGRVVGVFHSHTEAQRAINELRRLGFNESELGVASRSDEMHSTLEGDGHDDAGEKAATGATTGAVAGLGAGALWGLGIAAGVLPAIGPVIAGGTLAAIAASAATGAAAAGIAGVLIGMGFTEEEATYYDEEFRSGRVIVTVDAGGRAPEAEGVMAKYGGYSRETART